MSLNRIISSLQKQIGLMKKKQARLNILCWGSSYAKFTKITEVNLSAFVYRLFHEDFSPIVGTNLDWREIFMKQSVNKCR